MKKPPITDRKMNCLSFDLLNVFSFPLDIDSHAALPLPTKFSVTVNKIIVAYVANRWKNIAN